ncbi:MAG: CBS domain-containing protein [Acidobacteria bacterium]|nr:CBS domain-containing protein [Acidobacteriota bacterium]MCI0628633.1 CBS domain-containing protein [Acidobacteriota bacterium]MCI0723019.1 CBS domain-containing protein [Acidobacteriota bacterium]
MERCKDFMTQDPTCCVPNESVERAAQLMMAEDVGSIPVIDDSYSRKLIGILTDRDIALRIVAEARDAGHTAVRDVMTKTPLCCGTDDDVQLALDTMARSQVRRVPIVDSHNRVVGIIAQGDVATRFGQPEKTAQVVKEISRPAVEA